MQGWQPDVAPASSRRRQRFPTSGSGIPRTSTREQGRKRLGAALREVYIACKQWRRRVPDSEEAGPRDPTTILAQDNCLENIYYTARRGATAVERQTARKDLLKQSFELDRLPEPLILKGVQRDREDVETIAGGSSADFYLAQYRGHPVLLKRYRPHIATHNTDEEERHRKAHLRELIFAATVEHNHVMSLVGVSCDVFRNITCAVFPLMKNGDLRFYLRNLRNANPPNDPLFFVTKMISLLEQTARGLAYLHSEHIIHGDLHPGNILVDDFGAARLTDYGHSTVCFGTENAYGSFHGGGAIFFTAPELNDPSNFGLETTRPTNASDVYAFGCVCMEAYTGELPFHGLGTATVYQVVVRVAGGERPPYPAGHGMSSRMWEMINSCWAQNPNDRPDASAAARLISPSVRPSTTT